jgi:hypothetical protein
MYKNFLALIFIFLISSSYAQVNIMGKPGYMHIPSANWFKEQPLGLSFGFIPNEYSDNILMNKDSSPLGDNINIYNIRVGLLSFLEVNLGVAYRPALADKIGIGDRQLEFRFLLVNETKNYPSVVIGWTPPGSVSPALANDYIVASKKLSGNYGEFEFTTGYGSPYVLSRKNNDNGILSSLYFRKKTENYGSRYLIGFFGGFSYMPWEFAGIMAEYNTHSINTGVFLKIKDRVFFQAYIIDGKQPAFNLAMNFSLELSPNALRKYEKSLD